MIREAIRRRMRELDLNPYKLAKRLHGRMPQATVYHFLNRGGATSIENLDTILCELDLVIVAHEKPKRVKEKSKR